MPSPFGAPQGCFAKGQTDTPINRHYRGEGIFHFTAIAGHKISFQFNSDGSQRLLVHQSL